MENICLTRYLYEKTDVKLMIVNTLIHKRTLDELLFWLSECIDSGFIDELYALTWTIYFDFYAVQYPEFFSYINKRLRICNNEDNATSRIVGILSIYKNLLRLTPSHHMFEFRLYMKSSCVKKTVMPGRKPKWVSCYSKATQTMLRCINKELSDGIIYEFNKCHDYSDVYNNLVLYVNSLHDKENIPHKSINTIVKQVSNVITQLPYRLLSLYILYMLCIKHPETSENSRKKIYIKISKKEVERFHNNTKTQTRMNYNWQFINKLPLYPVNRRFVHIFNHCRKDINYKELIWYNWKQYAFNTPLWRERFKQYSGVWDTEQKTVVFACEDKEDDFHFRFGLELDEQERSTQDNMVFEYKKSPIQYILGEIFNKDNGCVDTGLDNKAYYTYI